LKSLSSGLLYVGITEDFDRRFKEHNSGKSKFTSGHIPWILIFKEEHSDFGKASIVILEKHGEEKNI